MYKDVKGEDAADKQKNDMITDQKIARVKDENRAYRLLMIEFYWKLGAAFEKQDILHLFQDHCFVFNNDIRAVPLIIESLLSKKTHIELRISSILTLYQIRRSYNGDHAYINQIESSFFTLLKEKKLNATLFNYAFFGLWAISDNKIYLKMKELKLTPLSEVRTHVKLA